MTLSTIAPVRRLTIDLVRMLALPVLATSLVSAQGINVGNNFVQGTIFTSPPDNRFTINAGPAQNGVKFLYGATANSATSNIVFRIESGGSVYYYTNCNVNSAFTYRPIVAETGLPATFKPYDSLYVSADTVAIGYRNMSGWNVTQRWIVEKPRNPYDDGTDLLLEFSATVNQFAPPGSVGIFLMLDLYNGEAGDPNPSDFTSVVTDRAYYPRGQVGKRFDPLFDTIPNFYTTGNVTMQPAAAGAGVPYNVRMPIHRLTGMSQGGRPLTTPDMLAFGDWRQMRLYSWEAYGSEVGTTPLNDIATSMRWANVTDGRTVRTAFGMNNRLGNNIYTCRDTGFFVMMRTERVVEQRIKNGAYAPAAFDLEVWVVNLNNSLQRDIQLYFQTPIQSNRGANRLLLDASTPATQGLTIPANGVRKARFRLNFNPAYSDDSANVVPEIRYAVPTRPGFVRRFKQLCTPTITIKRYIDVPPPRDTIAPAIVRGVPGRTTTAFWPFTIFDRHPGYRFDTGLDGIIVEANDAGNFRLRQTPAPFRRCDTTVTVDLVAEVIDTTRPARIVFSAFDCAGNVRRDSAIYSPRPDLFAPSILRIDSSGGNSPACNTRRFEVYLLDSLVQRPDAGDNGLGSVNVIGALVNFSALEVNFDVGGTPIADFDRRASFRISVLDSMQDAHAAVQVADYAGNADTLIIDYCTLPDAERPRTRVVTTSTGGPWVWHVETTDSLAWDRGLQDVMVLANLNNNMAFVPPPLTPGDRTGAWDVSAVDDRQDGEIIFEIRDRWYAIQPAGHADTVAIRFLKIPDTLSPNIIFNAVPGTGGSRADVEVNDIHYFGPQRYRYDLGLASVRVTDLSPNMELATPISFVVGDSVARFGVRIKDTLAFYTVDSVCIEAVDGAGNASSLCFYYPISPDTKSPIFVGRIDRSAGRLVGTATDDRLYDRGMGEITIEGAENLDPSTLTVQRVGDRSVPYTVALVDVVGPVRGTLVVRDLVAVRDRTPESEVVHSIRIPFDLPIAALDLAMPDYVEGGQPIRLAVIAASRMPGDAVRELSFSVDVQGSADWVGSVDARAALAAFPGADGRLDVQVSLDPAAQYGIGDTLGELVWTAPKTQTIGVIRLALDASTLVANGGVGTLLTGGPVQGDTAISVLEVPAPLFRVTTDSVVFVNGECERFLTTDRVASRPNGLAILRVYPTRVISSDPDLDLDIRDLATGGGRVELLDALGRSLWQTGLGSVGGRLTRVVLPLPRGLAAGMYTVVLTSGGQHDWVRIIVAN